MSLQYSAVTLLLTIIWWRSLKSWQSYYFPLRNVKFVHVTCRTNSVHFNFTTFHSTNVQLVAIVINKHINLLTSNDSIVPSIYRALELGTKTTNKTTVTHNGNSFLHFQSQKSAILSSNEDWRLPSRNKNTMLYCYANISSMVADGCVSIVWEVRVPDHLGDTARHNVRDALFTITRQLTTQLTQWLKNV